MQGYWSLLALPVSAAVAWLLTEVVRRYATTRAMLDVPNARSLHSRPTPRGGGLAIAIVVFAAVLLLAWRGQLPPGCASALLGGGVAVALVGWLDDRSGLSPAVRGLVHIAAAAWVVSRLGGLAAVDLGSRHVPLGPAGPAVSMLAIVWMTNLYNFMDGIDGLAGVEAVTVGAAGGLLLWITGAHGLALLAFVIASASAGFLAHNWEPARIFMGDVGSGLLGFLFAVLALAGDRVGAVPALAWAMLLGVFLFDATATLLRRILARQAPYRAHRTHAYQRAAQAGWSHASVCLLIAGTNVLLAALALTATRYPDWALPAFAVATAGLAGLYLAIEPTPPHGGHGRPAGGRRATRSDVSV